MKSKVVNRLFAFVVSCMTVAQCVLPTYALEEPVVEDVPQVEEKSNLEVKVNGEGNVSVYVDGNEKKVSQNAPLKEETEENTQIKFVVKEQEGLTIQEFKKNNSMVENFKEDLKEFEYSYVTTKEDAYFVISFEKESEEVNTSIEEETEDAKDSDVGEKLEEESLEETESELKDTESEDTVEEPKAETETKEDDNQTVSLDVSSIDFGNMFGDVFDIGQLIVSLASDAGGGGGESGTWSGVGDGGVWWTIHDNNDQGFGYAGTVANPNADIVVNLIKNAGFIDSYSRWGTSWANQYGVIPMREKASKALADAIQQCQDNYQSQFGTFEGFQPRIVAVGIAYANGPAGKEYNSSAIDKYESEWRGAWNNASKNGTLVLNHLNESYGVNDTFHNGSQSLTGFALTQLAGNTNIRIIVLDETQPIAPPKEGNLKLEKKSANPSITNGNNCYSLAGAVYGVYEDNACTKSVGTLTTNANGESNTIEKLKEGTYFIKETKAPKGYALDTKVYPVKVTADQTYTAQMTDKPQSDPVAILLKKVDSSTKADKGQGGASLEGAEYTIRYYDGQYANASQLSGVTPTRSWVVKTNKNGYSRLSNEYKVSGDAFYTATNGDIVLPIGTVSIQETKAPKGYKVNSEIFIRQITANGSTEAVKTYNEPTVPETVIEGEFSITKFINNNLASDVMDPEVNAKFGVVLESYYNQANKDMAKAIELAKKNGTKAEYSEMTTDKNGYATSGKLAYGKYVVKQMELGENATEAIAFDKELYFEVSEQNGKELVYGTTKDGKRIESSSDGLVHFYIADVPFTTYVSIAKVDAESGELVTLNNASFQNSKDWKRWKV